MEIDKDNAGILCILFLYATSSFMGFCQSSRTGNGNAEVVTLDGKVVGAANVGQKFTKDIYFWGRPSAADYTADASAGSNKGPTNPEYLEDVEVRIDPFLVHHPYLKRNEVPAEMVTASGSGLDPHITPQSAEVQIKRVAKSSGVCKKIRSVKL